MPYVMGERGSYAQKQTSIISIQTIILEISFYIRELAKICNFAVNIALNKFQKNTNCLKWVICVLNVIKDVSSIKQKNIQQFVLHVILK